MSLLSRKIPLRKAACIEIRLPKPPCGCSRRSPGLDPGQFRSGAWQPQKLADVVSNKIGPVAAAVCARRSQQADHAIDWGRTRRKESCGRSIGADSAPGCARRTARQRVCFFYGAHEEERLKGLPGLVLAARDGAVCVGTVDGAVWISHLKAERDRAWGCAQPAGYGRPTTRCTSSKIVAGNAGLGTATSTCPSTTAGRRAGRSSHLPRDRLSREDEVGYLSFDFHNGAMSTSQCYRLRDAFLYARARPPGSSCCWAAPISGPTVSTSTRSRRVRTPVESWRND